MTGFFDWQAAFGKAEVDRVDATPSENVDLDSTRTRRARLGARIRAFRNTDIEATGEFAGDGDYSGIERLSARTEFRPDAGVILRQVPPAVHRGIPPGAGTFCRIRTARCWST